MNHALLFADPRWTVCDPFVLEPAVKQVGTWLKGFALPAEGYRIPINTPAPYQGNVGSRRVVHHENSRVNESVAQHIYLDKCLYIAPVFLITAQPPSCPPKKG